MGQSVRITDVSPRDGLQNESGVIPTDQKIRLVEMLSATGVDEVEITSFVSPKWVPQLGDASDVAAGVQTFAEGVRMVAGALERGGTGRSELPVYSVLAPNERGFEGVAAAHDAGFPLKVAVFTAASETFSRKNTNASIEESIARFGPIVDGCVERELPMRFYVSCAVACPFEGPIEPAAVRSVVDRLIELVRDRDASLVEQMDLDLGDTIGVAHPDEITALLGQFSDDERARITLHLHDTFGRASACVKTALGMGVRSFDGSAAGLGGCPYASKDGERAPGNISTELLVRSIEEAGYETAVDLELLAEASAYAQAIVERARERGGAS